MGQKGFDWHQIKERKNAEAAERMPEFGGKRQNARPLNYAVTRLSAW
jgi:hypothetical protein